LTSFLAELKHKDLQILRKVVKKVHMHYYPSDLKISNREADKIIEAMGPMTVEAIIKNAVDNYGAGR
jgi:hypothetical protein